MPKFETAVLAALSTLPKGAWQRVDGLMTERTILELYPTRFAGMRLWLLEKRGLIERWTPRDPWLSTSRLRYYRLRTPKA